MKHDNKGFKKIITILLLLILIAGGNNLSAQQPALLSNPATETLELKAGWNWLSFPRLERTDNNPAPAIQLLERINYFPNVYLTLTDQYKNKVIWDEYGWTADFVNVMSTNGYILEMELTDAEAPYATLYGARLDPATPITLYAGQENWIGYFIPEAQMPLDAFPAATLAHITSIKAQNWAMIRQEADPEWFIKGRVMPIQYGDMVKVTVDQTVDFSWNQPAEAAEEMALLVTDYYSYEEQADYMPLFVEMDAESDIQEIAVLANGEVRGAAVRESGDTLVQVSAYLDGVPAGTPLTFETWSGLKSAPAAPGSYDIHNQYTGIWEARALYKGENASYQRVSLKATATQLPAITAGSITCAPNPFSSHTTFTIRIDQTALVRLLILDINGNLVRELTNGTMPEGLYQVTWDGTGANGSPVNDGIYHFSFTINQKQQASGKMVLIK
jgi:hypothetical protein